MTIIIIKIAIIYLYDNRTTFYRIPILKCLGGSTSEYVAKYGGKKMSGRRH
jgi:hypothetical protein